MGQAITDGKGRGFQAEVNEEQELVVRSIVESELEHASIEGNAYIWYSGSTQNLAADDTFLFIRNDGDTPLVLDRLVIMGSNVICTWAIRLGNATTTPAGGSVVTGLSLNQRFSGEAADVTARTGETAVADASLAEEVITAVTTTHHHTLNGYILEKGQFIQINQVTESTSGSCTIVGHFENPS